MDWFVGRFGRRWNVPAVRRAFQLTFRSPVGAEHVLPDFAEFCYAREMMPRGLNEFERGRWIGRHDVWLHLQEWLQLSEEELSDVIRGRSIFTGKEIQQ